MSAKDDLWSRKADDFRHLAKAYGSSEARDVFAHLAMRCDELAAATRAAEGARAPGIVREHTPAQWRARENEYRAIAEKCQSAEGREAWLCLAARAAEVGDYLDHAHPGRRAGGARRTG